MFQLVGPQHALAILGVKLVGANEENAKKLLFTLILIAALWIVVRGVRAGARWILLKRGARRAEFWTRQAIHLLAAIILIFGTASIWFDDPTRMTTALGLLSAGVAVALQKVITAIAGYFVILRGKIFNVGDRIVMGGVRGDVIALDFTRTSIMEMGQPPPVQSAEPAMWVQSRQYTGRIVTVSNARIFDEPVYNFTRDFPFLWEELHIPIEYGSDHRRAEEILIAAARKHCVQPRELSEDALKELQRRYFLRDAQVDPRVYVRLTDNWIEMSVRYVTRDYGIRETKDAMSREILAEFEKVGISVASATMQVTTFDGGSAKAT